MKIGDSVLLPLFSEQHLQTLIQEVTFRLMSEKPLKMISGTVVIVGDLHGNIHDLFSIISLYGLPPKINYLFLGDYVDRGDFSLEVITLLFMLKAVYPDNITLLRGNHEFKNINELYGFKDSCLSEYAGTMIFDAFNNAFCYLPIAAVINNKYFAVHGGLSKHLTSISQIQNLKFPILSDELPLLNDLVWSDPAESQMYFGQNYRGGGCTFGRNVVKEFLEKNDLKMIIRGHECVDGFRYNFNTSVVTVFSASNYGGLKKNHSGAMLISDNDFIKLDKLAILPYVRKTECNFYPVVLPGRQPQQRVKSLSFMPGSFISSPKLIRSVQQNVQLLRLCQ